MSQAFVLAPPPQTTRRRAVRPAPTPRVIQVVPVAPIPKAQPQSYNEVKRDEVIAKVDTPTQTRPRTKSLKSHLKSPFSKSSTSLPTAPVVPAFPVELASKSKAEKAEAKEKGSKQKSSKKSKSSKADAAEASSSSKPSRSAHAKPVRPVPYAAIVQINMIMDGGSQDYWLNRSRQVGEDTEVVGNGVEVGGFKDDNGQIWWDAEEKAEWTSLIPKDDAAEPSPKSDMWVSFNGDRRSSISSEDSYISMISTDDAEEIDEYVHYGVVEAEPAKMTYANRRAEGSVLFPIDMRDERSAERAAARAIIAQAQAQSLKPGALATNTFEDHFLSYDSDIDTSGSSGSDKPKARIQATKPGKKGGFLKSLWGKQ